MILKLLVGSVGGVWRKIEAAVDHGLVYGAVLGILKILELPERWWWPQYQAIFAESEKVVILSATIILSGFLLGRLVEGEIGAFEGRRREQRAALRRMDIRHEKEEEALRAGLPLPQPEIDPELIEKSAIEVARRGMVAIGRLFRRNPSETEAAPDQSKAGTSMPTNYDSATNAPSSAVPVVHIGESEASVGPVAPAPTCDTIQDGNNVLAGTDQILVQAPSVTNAMAQAYLVDEAAAERSGEDAVSTDLLAAHDGAPDAKDVTNDVAAKYKSDDQDDDNQQILIGGKR